MSKFKKQQNIANERHKGCYKVVIMREILLYEYNY